MTLTKREMWIKAAIERRTLEFVYLAGRHSGQRRRVHPDTIKRSGSGRAARYYCIWDSIHRRGPCSFYPRFISGLRVTNDPPHQPHPRSQAYIHREEYKRLRLNDRSW